MILLVGFRPTWRFDMEVTRRVVVVLENNNKSQFKSVLHDRKAD